MNFLAPLFLAGAAAVALPFIFHLIRRSSREKIVFSSLMFLEPSPPRITKRSRLEHLLLLLLRCAVLALLAFAFARPFLQKPLAASAAGDQRAQVAVLVDGSASMRREDLWDQARGRAVEAVRQLKPGDALALYVFDQQLRSVLSFADAARMNESQRVAATESRLAAFSPGWFGTHLGSAILNATEHLLEQVNRDAQEQGNTTLRVVVISDFQSGTRLDGLQGFEWPKKLEVQLEPLTGKEKSNAGLQVLEESQKLFSALTNAPVRIRVSNSAQAGAEQFTLQWRRGVEPLGEPVKAYVPPGQNRTITLAAPPEADSIALAGDRVSFDNTAYRVRPQSRPVTIAYFGSERPDDPSGMRYYLHRAFEQTNLSTRVLAFSNAIPPEARESGLLILGAVPGPEVIALAESLLGAGRTVLLPLRDSAQVNTVSALTGGLLVAAPEAKVGNYALFGQISFQHSLFAPFSDARFSDFTKIHFWKYRAVNLANLTNATTIASLDSGSPLLAEIPIEKGRLLLLATTWMPSDSQLALSSKFIPLLFGILEQSAGSRVTAHQFHVGDSVPLPPGLQGQVRLPDGSARPSAPIFTETALPGIYTAGEYQFAVNLDSAESKLAPLAPEDLSSLGVPLNLRSDPGEVARAEQRQRHLLATETEARQKLWRTFLLAAIGFVLVETWLSGRLSRTVAPVARSV